MHDAPPPPKFDAPMAVIDGSCTGQLGKPRVLVFSRENLWNHASTPVARQAILDMCQTRGFSVIASSDPAVFYDGHLASVDVVVFAVTSGPILDAAARSEFQSWLANGHGMVGIHSASATELESPFFIKALGGQFWGHPPGFQEGRLIVTDTAHPIVAGYPQSTLREDEWYSFVEHPEADPNTHVLLALDESSLPADYPADLKMGFHAIAWTHVGFGGRSFYVALGHRVETYQEPTFLTLLANGISWAAAQL